MNRNKYAYVRVHTHKYKDGRSMRLPLFVFVYTCVQCSTALRRSEVRPCTARSNAALRTPAGIGHALGAELCHHAPGEKTHTHTHTHIQRAPEPPGWNPAEFPLLNILFFQIPSLILTHPSFAGVGFRSSCLYSQKRYYINISRL